MISHIMRHDTPIGAGFYAQPLDKVGTLALTQSQGFWKERLLSFKRVITRIMVFILVLLNGHTYAYGASTHQQINNYKLYAHNRIFDANQYECYQQLITRESQWNAQARNGSMYGLPQGHSKWLATVDAYQQIDWSISYITHRYAPTKNAYCIALTHSLQLGWY